MDWKNKLERLFLESIFRQVKYLLLRAYPSGAHFSAPNEKNQAKLLLERTL
jgi:hypothetical protein